MTTQVSSQGSTMGRIATGPSFDDHRRAVEQMVADDVGFEPVAEAIEASDRLAPDQKAALWLLAWSLLGADAEPGRGRLAVGGQPVLEPAC
ncbi:MAG: hypothetical protein ACJ76S_12830 [Solirubrobacteraceae bacterium]|jgi:hypothetical protein